MYEPVTVVCLLFFLIINGVVYYCYPIYLTIIYWVCGMGSGEITFVFISEFLGSTVTIAESENHYTLSFDMKHTLYHSEILDFDLNAMIK